MAKKTPKPQSPNKVDIEEIEGLDGPEDDGLGDYPIDTLAIRTENRTVFEVVRRISSGDFIMNPDFQRDFVWDANKQSKLIESVVMRIPLPVFYLAENTNGKMVVVDGLQRLSTFRDFLADEFSLKLPYQDSLNKRHFSDLTPKLKNRIEDCNLVLYLIDSKVPEQAKLDIFERVNSGEILTRQQMRNCLYSGSATRWLKQEATSDIFVEATGGSLNVKQMRDREFANRFCGFMVLGVAEYKKDMDDFLAKTLTVMNDYSESELKELSRNFRLGVQNNSMLFGRHAFRKHAPDQADRSVINASLWDVMSTGFAAIPNDLVKSKADTFRARFYKLLNDSKFSDAITYSPNSTKKVLIRFNMARELFKEVFGDHAN